jgi:hypothetical protein
MSRQMSIYQKINKGINMRVQYPRLEEERKNGMERKITWMK